MNISSTIRSFRSRLRSSAHPDPMRDWLILVTLFLFAFVCIVVWNAWAFDTVANGGAIGPVQTSTSPVFDNASVDAIHNVFTKRASEAAKYETGVYRFADPSQ